MKYARPDQLEDALGLLAAGQWSILAGGTDYYPALRDLPARGNILDLWRLTELKRITNGVDHLRIGALVTWSELLNAPLPNALHGLQQSAREIGSVQIQNRATLVGNICNASPAADGVPPLLTLDAEIELVSVRGVRRLPLASFLQGNRRTDKQPDELVTAILVPNSSLRGQSCFSKLGFRKYLVISVTMVAVRLVMDSRSCISDAFVSVGSCSAVAQRLIELERALVGRPANDSLRGLVQPAHLTALTPIDDVRAGRDYRRSATLVLITRALEQVRSQCP